MTREKAVAHQAEALSEERWLMWFVSTAEPGYVGQAVAWGTIADQHGGERLPGLLVAPNIEELRSRLPEGLVRRERTYFMPAEVIETWD